MVSRAYAVLVCIVMLTTSSHGLAALREFSTIRVGPAVMASTGATPPADRGVPKITWVIDFADYAGGPIEAWLHTKGFRTLQRWPCRTTRGRSCSKRSNPSGGF